MGINDREGTGQRKNKRGSVNNANRLAGLTGGKDKTATADWGACDPRWLQAIAVAITRLGGAVTYSVSRDGGAYGLRLFLDDQSTPLWFNGDADLDVELEKVLAYLETLQ